ncbi:glycosyltransferase [Alteribacillus sp. HJP-4]|uniref:glycosyltransferase family 4 protein n=1 Tax=Alteribacillus sp. HJP-4 TaxID=2775394 RepID=UPI0035CCE75C
MNVLIICTEKLPVPAIRGGAIQTYIDGALPELKQKHNITVLGRSDELLPSEELKGSIRYVRVDGGILEIYRENVMQFLSADPTSYDLIHIFNRPRLVNTIRAVAPDSKIILSMHNDMFKAEKIDRDEGALAVRNVNKIITISNYIGHTIKELFPEAAPKLKTIYSGVDLERFVPSYSREAREIRSRIRNEHGLGSKKVILYAGRLSPNKGIDVLIRAIPELIKQHSDIALVIMGSKWFSEEGITDYIAYVRALAERLPIQVIQTGFVPSDKIQEWFAASDIFVCTSQWQEPLARVHYEAMAAAIPIITTDRGGNKEVMEPYKNGIVVTNPEDTGEFATHLAYLLSNPKAAQEMGRYGRTLAEKHYTWDRVVNDILTVWDEVEHMSAEDLIPIEENLLSETSETNSAAPPLTTEPAKAHPVTESDETVKASIPDAAEPVVMVNPEMEILDEVPAQESPSFESLIEMIEEEFEYDDEVVKNMSYSEEYKKKVEERNKLENERIKVREERRKVKELRLKMEAASNSEERYRLLAQREQEEANKLKERRKIEQIRRLIEKRKQMKLERKTLEEERKKLEEERKALEESK